MSDKNFRERQAIKDKKTKKLIFVFSDGESDDAPRLQAAIQARRGQGVYVYGIGIGNAANVTHYLSGNKDQGGGEKC